MDINSINNTYRAQLPSSTTNKEAGFKQIFDRKLSEIDAITPRHPVEGKKSVLENSDRLLDLLDDYARNLSDPAKTLKDIGPLVERITEEVSLIKAESTDNVHHDDKLERIIEDLVVTTNVALFKFHRGDYL